MGVDFSIVMNNINDCIIVYGSETNDIIYCNDKFRETFGYAQEELSHISFESIITDESKNYFKKIEKLLKEAENGKPQLFECRFKSKYNRPLCLEVYLKNIQHECEKLFLAVMYDVNKYKQQEEKYLCESEKKYQTLIENIPIHISASDKLYKIVLWNNYAEKLLGYKAEEMVGRAPAQVLHESKKDADDVVQTSIKKGIYDKEINFVHKSGKLVPVHLVVVPWKDAKNRIIGFFGFAKNVAERKEAEKKFRNYQEQLRCLASALSLSEERERRRIATELHDCVGHALGISKIKLESIQEAKLKPHIRKSIDEIHDIINKMIADTRSLTFELSPPILYELGLEATLEWLIEDIYKRHGISGVVVDDKRPKPLDKDVRVILFQSVRELLINVVKHSKASNVRVLIKRNSGYIVINVEDDGIGFKTRQVNSNLSKNFCFGFFSIRERLNHIGGSFEIKAEPDKGTCVTLVAPLSRKT